MLSVFLWYLVISIIGWLTFPLAYHLLPALKDRGYTISRALGFLIWGYSFWLLTSLGILRNEIGSLLFCIAILFLLSFLSLRNYELKKFYTFLKTNRKTIFTSEILFLVAFVTWAIVRAANPEALGTEKPMELAFINAILNSSEFPPFDPWLSGYAISYYHFGYILIAMLAKITATPGALAFNLGSALTFALSAIGAYGLVYNLINANYENTKNNLEKQHPHHTITALLGPLFLLIVSNLEGFLHVLHRRGFFWRRDPSGQLTSKFWQWLDIQDLTQAPTEPFSWIPTKFWWWWRASRVVQDYDLAGNPKEIIDEFPFFSYLLGDLHPHVLVMPFALLAITLALNFFLDKKSSKKTWFEGKLDNRLFTWSAMLAIPIGLFLIYNGANGLDIKQFFFGILFLVMSGFIFVYQQKALMNYGLRLLIEKDIYTLPLRYTLTITPAYFLLAALCLGGIGFLNTWDFPFFLALFSAAYTIKCTVRERKSIPSALIDFFSLSIMLGLVAILLYLPFYLGFSSQAGGILPNLIYITRGAHLWVMFAPLLIPIFIFLLFNLFQSNHISKSILTGIKLTSIFFLIFGIFSIFLGLVIIIIPQLGDFFQATLASPGTKRLFSEALLRRFQNIGGWGTLFILLSLTLASIHHLVPQKNWGNDEILNINVDEKKEQDQNLNNVNLFILLLILWGTLLVITPEFVYLRDLFGWRINTIFKFYYQTWLYWSIAAAYISIYLLTNLRRYWRRLFEFFLIINLFIALIYPVLSLWSKTNGFRTNRWTLDGTAYMQSSSYDEMQAIEWLQSAPHGVIAEAVPETGGSYTQYARVSTISGKPAVLGWVGHENQWRGKSDALGTRQEDLYRLYCSRDWEIAQEILNRYNIRYIFVGPLERSTYIPGSPACPVGIMENKFDRYLNPVYQQGSVIIYENPDAEETRP